MSNSIEINTTPNAPYILVEGEGMWTVDQVQRHFHDLERNIRAMRARCGTARVLADMRHAQVQTAEVVQVMISETARIYREHDRVAVIVATKLMAMQVKRSSTVHDRQTFEDHAQALAWLVSQIPAPPSLGA